MFSHCLKAGAALALLLANVQMASAQVRAQDLAGRGTAQSQIAIKAAAYPVAEINHNIESDNAMSPMPNSGNLAMLIAGICMIGFAARRQPTAA